jgi:hypothetical protein
VRIFLVILGAILLFGGIGTEARAQEDVTIQIGKKKSVDKGRLQISFISVLEDSRCPMNARCIWAGNARIKLLVSRGRGPTRAVELNTGDDPQTVSVFGYTLELVDLKPHKGDPSPVAKKTSAVISLRRGR